MANPDPGSSRYLDELLQKTPSIKHVRYTIVTLFGTIETRVLPLAQCKKHIGSEKENQRVYPFSLRGGFGDLKDLAANFESAPDLWRPYWASVKALDQFNASVICSVSDTKNDYGRCPRDGFRVLLECPKTKQIHPIKVSFDLEFYLLKRTSDTGRGWEDPTSVPESYWWKSTILLPDTFGSCLAACADAVEDAGIGVEYFHGNASPYRCVISLEPERALESADAVVQALEIVRRTARSRGFHACFHPKPFPRDDPSGLHARILIDKDISDDESDRFLAGIMRRLDILLGIGMPFEAASRIEPEICGEWQAWGTSNKGVPIQKIDKGHFEIRCIDCMSNIYLVLASYIAAGRLGIEKEDKLEQKDCVWLTSRMTDEGRQKLGIDKRLPSTSIDSLKLLEKDFKGLSGVIGEELLKFFLNVRLTDRKMDQTDLRLASY